MKSPFHLRLDCMSTSKSLKFNKGVGMTKIKETRGDRQDDNTVPLYLDFFALNYQGIRKSIIVPSVYLSSCFFSSSVVPNPL